MYCACFRCNLTHPKFASSRLPSDSEPRASTIIIWFPRTGLLCHFVLEIVLCNRANRLLFWWREHLQLHHQPPGQQTHTGRSSSCIVPVCGKPFGYLSKLQCLQSFAISLLVSLLRAGWWVLRIFYFPSAISISHRLYIDLYREVTSLFERWSHFASRGVLLQLNKRDATSQWQINQAQMQQHADAQWFWIGAFRGPSRHNYIRTMMSWWTTPNAAHENATRSTTHSHFLKHAFPFRNRFGHMGGSVVWGDSCAISFSSLDSPLTRPWTNTTLSLRKPP